MATIAETKARIKAIMALAPGLSGHLIPTFEKGDPIDPALIPGYIVYWPGLAEHQAIGGELRSGRRWMVEVLVQEFEDDDVLTKEAAYEACEPFLDSLALFFARHQFLGLDGTDTGLYGTPPITFRDGGVGEYPRGGKRYASISYPLNIATNTDF